MAVVTTQQSVAALYTAIFNRAPDQSGLNFWTSKINSGTSFTTVATGFAQHEVFTSGIGALGNADYVAALYINILGSAGDTAGIAYWIGRLVAGETKASVVAAFVQGSLTLDIAALQASGGISSADATAALVRQQTLFNKADVGVYYANTLGSASNLSANTVLTSKSGLLADPAYQASVAAIATVTNNPTTAQAAKDAITLKAVGSPGPSGPGTAPVKTVGGTFTLTSGDDSFSPTSSVSATQTSSGNDIFNAPAGTLSTLDSVDGGDGSDTLNVTISGATAASISPNLANVENVVVSGVGTDKLNLSASTGVTSVTIANSSAVAGTTVEAVRTANLAVVNQTTNATFTGSTATALGLMVNKAGTSGTPITINVTSAPATSLGVTAADSNIVVTGTGSVTKASIAATGTNTVDLSAATALASLTVTGTGTVNTGAALTTLATLDASAAGGAITFNNTGSVAASVKVDTGSGNDVLTVAGANLKSITTGGGDDTITVTGLLNTSAVLSGGAGNDTLNVTSVGAFTFAPTFIDIETLNVTFDTVGGGLDLAGMTGYTTVNSKSSTVTAAVSNLKVGTTVGVDTNQTITFGFADAFGSTDAATLVVSSVTSGNINMNSIENLTLRSTVGATPITTNTVALNNGSLTTLVITGDRALDLSVSNQAKSLNTVDAAALTGPLNYTGYVNASATSFTGTAAADTAHLYFMNVSNWTPTLTNLETLQLSTGSSLIISSLASTTGLNTIILDNAGAVNLTTGAVATPLTIDASTSTGAMTINGFAATGVLTLKGSTVADNLIGGSGADILNGGAGADTLAGGLGADKFVFASAAQTKGTAFLAANTSIANIDKISDFKASGADVIELGVAGAGFAAGGAVTFTAATTATVSAFATVGTINTFTELAAAVVTAAGAGGTTVVSTNAVAQIYDITVATGSLAGHYAVVLDGTAGVSTTDTFISIAGAPALIASDFAFVA